MDWKTEILNYCRVLEIEPPTLLLSKSELLTLLERPNWREFIDSQDIPDKSAAIWLRKAFKDILKEFYNHFFGFSTRITIDDKEPTTLIFVKDRSVGDKAVLKHELSHYFLDEIGVFDNDEKNLFIEKTVQTLENIPVANWKNYLRLHC